MFLYNFEAATLLKASFVYYSVMYVCVTEKRNFHHARDHDSFPYITSSQRKNNSALKYLEIYLKHLAYTGIMQSEEPRRFKQMAWNPGCCVMQSGGSASPSAASIASLFLATAQKISENKRPRALQLDLDSDNFHTYTYNFQS